MPALHSLSASSKILEHEFHNTRLWECDSLHSCHEILILACDTKQQPGETQDPLIRTSRTTKKARAYEARHEHCFPVDKYFELANLSSSLAPLWERQTFALAVFCSHKLCAPEVCQNILHLWEKLLQFDKYKYWMLLYLMLIA